MNGKCVFYNRGMYVWVDVTSVREIQLVVLLLECIALHVCVCVYIYMRYDCNESGWTKQSEKGLKKEREREREREFSLSLCES